MKVTCLLITTLFAGTSLWSQEPFAVQDSVFGLYMDFVRADIGTERSLAHEKEFGLALKSVLIEDVEAKLPFDSLKKYRVLLESADKQVRLFTWEVRQPDGTFIYSGIVHSKNKKSGSYEAYELKDAASEIRDPENAILHNKKWFGAYYYDIIPVKYKRKKYYVLLGWNGHNKITNMRLIDVLQFDSRGFPKFGHAMFANEKGKIRKRLIFEYQAGLFMSLKFEKGKDGIVFDHLSPSDPNLEGQRQFYGPDFTYDMLVFKNGRWEYKANVQPRNEKNKGDKLFNAPH